MVEIDAARATAALRRLSSRYRKLMKERLLQEHAHDTSQQQLLETEDSMRRVEDAMRAGRMLKSAAERRVKHLNTFHYFASTDST